MVRIFIFLFVCLVHTLTHIAEVRHNTTVQKRLVVTSPDASQGSCHQTNLVYTAVKQTLTKQRVGVLPYSVIVLQKRC